MTKKKAVAVAALIAAILGTAAATSALTGTAQAAPFSFDGPTRA